MHGYRAPLCEAVAKWIPRSISAGEPLSHLREFKIAAYCANGKRQIAMWRHQFNEDKLTKHVDKSRIAWKSLREV